MLPYYKYKRRLLNKTLRGFLRPFLMSFPYQFVDSNVIHSVAGYYIEIHKAFFYYYYTSTKINEVVFLFFFLRQQKFVVCKKDLN